MGQALHILEKDFRRLWPYVAGVLVMVAGAAVLDVRNRPFAVRGQGGETAAVSALLAIFLPVGFAFLVAMAIFEETLPGDRQFWLTRPYRWPELLAAKIVFAVIVINVPLFVSDCVVLAALDLEVATVLPRLLLRQVFLTLVFVLPSFTIATITHGLAQFVLAWLVIPVLLILEEMLGQFFTFNGPGIVFALIDGRVLVVIVGVIACCIVVCQYATRRTMAARLVALITVSAIVAGLEPAAWLASRTGAGAARPTLANETSIKLAYDLDGTAEDGSPNAKNSLPTGLAQVWLRIPLKVTGLPPGTLLRGGGQSSIVVSGKQWPVTGAEFASSVDRFGGASYYSTMHLPGLARATLDELRASIHTTLRLELVTDTVEAKQRLSERSFMIPGIGTCRPDVRDPGTPGQIGILFIAGLAPTTETAVRLDASPNPDALLGVVRAVRDVPWGLNPLTTQRIVAPQVRLGAVLAFVPRRRVAEFDTTVDASDVPLKKYVMAPDQDLSTSNPKAPYMADLRHHNDGRRGSSGPAAANR
jgi:hypothetical protein